MHKIRSLSLAYRFFLQVYLLITRNRRPFYFNSLLTAGAPGSARLGNRCPIRRPATGRMADAAPIARTLTTETRWRVADKRGKSMALSCWEVRAGADRDRSREFTSDYEDRAESPGRWIANGDSSQGGSALGPVQFVAGLGRRVVVLVDDEPVFGYEGRTGQHQ